jgi:hypothetical protein
LVIKRKRKAYSISKSKISEYPILVLLQKDVWTNGIPTDLIKIMFKTRQNKSNIGKEFTNNHKEQRI